MESFLKLYKVEETNITFRCLSILRCLSLVYEIKFRMQATCKSEPIKQKIDVRISLCAVLWAKCRLAMTAVKKLKYHR